MQAPRAHTGTASRQQRDGAGLLPLWDLQAKAPFPFILSTAFSDLKK